MSLNMNERIVMDTLRKGNIKVTIAYDEDPSPFDDPREWDNVTTMVCFHRRYNLGDKDHGYRESSYDSWKELEEAIREEHDILAMSPLFLYEHSGITISTGPFSCPWDSLQVGFVFVDREQFEKMCGTGMTREEMEKRAEEILEHEVEAYDYYIRNEIFVITVENEVTGVVLEEVGGYIGHKWTKEVAEDLLDFYNKKYPSLFD